MRRCGVADRRDSRSSTLVPADSKRSLSACAALSCVYFAAIGGFNPYAPLWYKELGMSVFAIGVLVSLQSWTRIFATYAWGALADHSGQRVQIIRWAALASFVAFRGREPRIEPLLRLSGITG